MEKINWTKWELTKWHRTKWVWTKWELNELGMHEMGLKFEIGVTEVEVPSEYPTCRST